MTTPNPIPFPSRFQIRQLTERDVPHALAIIAHSNAFHSPVWFATYPDGNTARVYRDGSEWAPILDAWPGFAYLGAELEKGDKRDPGSWKPKGFGEVIRRGGTATRQDYTGFGLMKGTAHWHIREMAAKGFSGYQITTAHPALKKAFLNPPPPFRGELVSKANTAEVEAEVDGKVVKPFERCEAFDCCLIWVHLKE